VKQTILDKGKKPFIGWAVFLREQFPYNEFHKRPTAH